MGRKGGEAPRAELRQRFRRRGGLARQAVGAGLRGEAPPTIAVARFEFPFMAQRRKDVLYFRTDDDNRGDCEGDKGDK